MNSRNKAAIAGLASTAVIVTGVGIFTAGTASAATDTLTTKQLVALYEEERLAGDVYETLGDVYDATIFDRIAASEDHHQSAVGTLLESRGYDISSLPTQPGDYDTDGYDEMYSDFVTTGSNSIDDAYGVGVTIEETDIEDLNALLDQTSDPTETQVLESLLAGSTHHLAAFSGDVTAGDGMQYGNGPAGNRSGGMGMQGSAGTTQGRGMQDGDCPFDGDQTQQQQGQRNGMQGQGMQGMRS